MLEWDLPEFGIVYKIRVLTREISFDFNNEIVLKKTVSAPPLK